MSVAVAGALALTAMMYGPQAALLAELFSTRVRYSGASLGYQIGAICGGGLAPLIATAIYTRSHSTFGISVYLAVVSLVSLVSVALLSETSRVDLHHERPVGVP